jgi:hypothetical protein
MFKSKKTNLQIFFLFHFLIFPSIIHAQAPDTLWTRAYGGHGHEWAATVEQTGDHGYIIIGTTGSFGAGGLDMYLIRTDSLGDTLWTRTYGGPDVEQGKDIIITQDGYLLVGSTRSFGAGEQDVYLVKTGFGGDTLWTRTYGGSDNDVGYSLCPGYDSNYIIVGETHSYGADSGDVYVICVDANGDTLWTKAFGGTDRDCAYSVQPTYDQGYIIAGQTHSFGAGEGDFWLIKINEQGHEEWAKTYGRFQNDVAYCVRQTNDHGFVVAGSGFWSMLGNEMVIYRTNERGDSLWKHCNGSLNNDEAYAIIELTNLSGYIFAGNFSYDAYIVRLDTSGSTLWSAMYGGIDNECAYDIKETHDQGYIVAGITNSYGAGGLDIYLVKTCLDTLATKEHQIMQSAQFCCQILPNPCRRQLHILFSVPYYNRIEITLYDITGQHLQTLLIKSLGPGIYKRSFDCKSLSNGVYYLGIKIGNNTAWQKFVHIR